MKIYFIAGEKSGDNIASKIISSLKKIYKAELIIKSVGGDAVESHGIKSLFSIKDINLMGFFEIIPKIFLIKKRIKETVDDIMKFSPDIVVTIDSPGFNIRVVKKLKSSGYSGKLVHIIAPSVWAYKPERAKIFANYYDLMLVILPFEPPYFLKENLDCRYVGHYALESNFCPDPSIFRKKYNLGIEDFVLLLTPGSRISEINRHLDIFLETAKLLRDKMIKADIQFKSFNILIVDSSNNINKQISIDNINIIHVRDNIYESYIAADIALAKSGTNTIEIAAHSIPMVVAFKINFLSWLYVKNIIKIKFASIINILANCEILPEFIQNNCEAVKISDKLLELVSSEFQRKEQLNKVENILSTLRNSNDKSPSILSAEYIIELLNYKN